ncbi:MAG: hypothetical protein ACXAB7_07620 [Candidatus Kariarchaeaceae archaeon]|jgi:hypothetical protein
MSSDPFENFPEHLRKAIKEMMRRLENVDPTKLQEMINHLIGEDFIDKIKDLMDDDMSKFMFSLDPNAIKNFELVMKDLMGGSPAGTSYEYASPKDETPYYEITPLQDGKGQIVIDMPGVDDVRQVMWQREEKILRVSATTSDVSYEVKIPFDNNYKLLDAFAEVKNSVFILPYQQNQ